MRSLPSFGLLVLPVFVLTTACNQADVAFTATGPSPLAANISLGSSFGVEPSTLRSELLPGACSPGAPFGVRLGLTIRGGEDIIVRGVRFSFVDPIGTRLLPEILPIPSPSGGSPTPARGIAPLPATSPIPIPGAGSITGVLVPAGAHRRLDYFLRFSCIVIAEGQIVVVIDAADGRGRPHTSEMRVTVER